MKALAASNLMHFEKAQTSLEEYNKTVELDLQIILKNQSSMKLESKPLAAEKLLGIVFGSDQGMCGQLNRGIVEFVQSSFKELNISKENRSYLCIGNHLASILEIIKKQ